MTKEEAKDLIIEVVGLIQGCQVGQLIMWLPMHPKVVEHTYRKDLYLGSPLDWIGYISELVDEGRLVEIQYHSSTDSTRRTMLFPANTYFRVFSGTKMEIVNLDK